MKQLFRAISLPKPQGYKKRAYLPSYVTIVLASCVAVLPSFAQQPQTALCAVCRVHEGATEPEKVVASSTHNGVTFYFCSKNCKKAFDLDPEAYIPPVFPRPAPNFSVKNLAGENVSLEKFRGQVVLLDFWATWCKPCVKSMPALQQLHERFSAKGLAVLGISTDANGAKHVPTFLAKHKISYPNFLDSGDEPAWERYKVKVLPMLFLIDRKGQIVQQWIGEVEPAKIERALAAYLMNFDDQNR